MSDVRVFVESGPAGAIVYRLNAWCSVCRSHTMLRADLPGPVCAVCGLSASYTLTDPKARPPVTH
jgi:hypothetical protein